jgi:protein-S-isoprenylcysteine O-methyltransferase Ste14
MTVRRRAATSTVWVLYLVIVLEFLFMISPVALHFYSSYGPILNVFHGSRATAWLTGFFLPHFSDTSSWLLNITKPLGFRLAYVGLLLFVIGAVQVYSAKIFRRGAVTKGLYRWIRHPQYLALAILGLGVTLIWARFLVLVSYVTMLFLYLVLARWEEKLCIAKYGENYRELQQRTGMIFPRAFEKFFYRQDPPRRRWGRGRLAALYVAALAVSLGLGFILREYSLRNVSAYYSDRIAVLSPASLTRLELEHAYQLASSDTELQEVLREMGYAAPSLIYVVPETWFLPDLPLHSEAEIRRIGGGHLTPDEFDRNHYKLLLTKVRTHSADATGRSIIRSAYGLDPVLIVNVNLATGEITSPEVPPTTVVWGDIPTPLF